MSVSPTDWQCCMPTEYGLRCTKALIYGSHDGPCVHEHDYELLGDETMCGCQPPIVYIPLPEGFLPAKRRNDKGPYHDVAEMNCQHVCATEPVCLCVGIGGHCDCTKAVGFPATCRKCRAPLILINCDTGEAVHI